MIGGIEAADVRSAEVVCRLGTGTSGGTPLPTTSGPTG